MRSSGEVGWGVGTRSQSPCWYIPPLLPGGLGMLFADPCCRRPVSLALRGCPGLTLTTEI